LACFAAGTPVLMADGSWKKIEEVRAGDKVLSVPEHDAEGPVESKKVIQAYNNEPQKLMELYINGEMIRCTHTHRFYDRFKGWTPANELELGDQLKTPDDRWLKVSNIVLIDAIEPVFNIHVADYHTYFVGNGSSNDFVLVHNQYKIGTTSPVWDHVGYCLSKSSLGVQAIDTFKSPLTCVYYCSNMTIEYYDRNDPNHTRGYIPDLNTAVSLPLNIDMRPGKHNISVTVKLNANILQSDPGTIAAALVHESIHTKELLNNTMSQDKLTCEFNAWKTEFQFICDVMNSNDITAMGYVNSMFLDFWDETYAIRGNSPYPTIHNSGTAQFPFYVLLSDYEVTLFVNTFYSSSYYNNTSLVFGIPYGAGGEVLLQMP